MFDVVIIVELLYYYVAVWSVPWMTVSLDPNPRLACPVCSAMAAPWRERPGVALAKCSACGHLFSLLGAEGYDEIYSAEYYQRDHANWFNNQDTNLFDRVACSLRSHFGDRDIQVLDVGCGTGSFLRHLAKVYPEAKLTGIDFHQQQQCESIRFHQGDFFTYPFEGKFDALVTLAVIEHVPDPALFLKKCHDLIEPGGLIAIMTVNSGGIMFAVANLAERFGFLTPFKRLYDRHHLQHFSNSSLRRLTESAGFSMQAQHNHNFPLAAVDCPKSNALLYFIYKAAVSILFAVSGRCGLGMLQTVVAKRDQKP